MRESVFWSFFLLSLVIGISSCGNHTMVARRAQSASSEVASTMSRPTTEAIILPDDGRPHALLAANGDDQGITVQVGDEINYEWYVNGVVSFTSWYTADQSDCPGGYDGSGPKPWVANDSNYKTYHTVNARVLPCQAGRKYSIWFQGVNLRGESVTLTTLHVTVLPDLPAEYAAGISRIAGDGQEVTNSNPTRFPLVVGVWNKAGIPIVGATVRWTILTGGDIFNLKDPDSFRGATTFTELTDGNGHAEANGIGFLTLGNPVASIVIKAEVEEDPRNGQIAASTLFHVTIVPPRLYLGVQDGWSAVVQPTSQRIDLKPGEIRPDAVIMNVGFENTLLPNMGVHIEPAFNWDVATQKMVSLDPGKRPSVHCLGDTVLTDSTGIAKCTLVAGEHIETGGALFFIRVGGWADHLLMVTVSP